MTVYDEVFEDEVGEVEMTSEIWDIMDSVVDDTIELARNSHVFNYDAGIDGYDMRSDTHQVFIEINEDESFDDWDIHAVVKNSAGDTLATYFDSGDSLEEVRNGEFKDIFEKFMVKNILQYFNEVD